LELGIGTGRVAIPVSQKGIEVHGIDAHGIDAHGIDASGAMVKRLREKPGGTFQ
jgi:ubiquinone/menaquinone biosynthesis C-methylase UbiE